MANLMGELEDVDNPVRTRFSIFTGNDTDNHDFICKAAGSEGGTIIVDNPASQTLTVKLYGVPTEDTSIGNRAAIQIGSDITLTTNTGSRTVFTETYPYYLIRASFGSLPSPTTTTPKLYMAFV